MRVKLIKLLSVATLACVATSAAYAVGPGLYVGAQVGPTNVHNMPTNINVPIPNPFPPPQTTTMVVLAPASNTGIGGRFFFGSNYNQYVGFEMGYTRYATASFKPSPQGNLANTPKSREMALDLLLKGMLPIGPSGFSALGKIGMIYLTRSTSGSVTGGGNFGGVRGEIGVGFSYDFNQSWVGDFTLNRALSHGTVFQNADLIAIGLSYHFTDKFCGQFLC